MTVGNLWLQKTHELHKDYLFLNQKLTSRILLKLLLTDFLIEHNLYLFVDKSYKTTFKIRGAVEK